MKNHDYDILLEKTKRLLLAETQGKAYANNELMKLKKLSFELNSDFYERALSQFDIINNFNNDLTSINFVFDNSELESLARSILGYDNPFDLFGKDDIVKYFVKLPDNIAIAEIEGDSMIDAGLEQGDNILFVKTQEINSGDMIVAIVDGNRYVKYYKQIDKDIYLVSANKNYPDFKVGITNNFIILGKVVQILKNVKARNLDN